MYCYRRQIVGSLLDTRNQTAEYGVEDKRQASTKEVQRNFVNGKSDAHCFLGHTAQLADQN